MRILAINPKINFKQTFKEAAIEDKSKINLPSSHFFKENTKDAFFMNGMYAANQLKREDAEKYLKEGLERHKSTKNIGGLIRCHMALGDLYFETNKYQDSAIQYDHAIDNISKSLSGKNLQQLKDDFENYKETGDVDLVDNCMSYRDSVVLMKLYGIASQIYKEQDEIELSESYREALEQIRDCTPLGDKIIEGRAQKVEVK